MAETQQAGVQESSHGRLGVVRESVAFVLALVSAVVLSQLLFRYEGAELGLWGASACGAAVMGAYVIRAQGKWRQREEALRAQLDRAASVPEHR